MERVGKGFCVLSVRKRVIRLAWALPPSPSPSLLLRENSMLLKGNVETKTSLSSGFLMPDTRGAPFAVPR